MSSAPDAPTPDAGGGPVDALQKAMANAPDAAAKGLNRAMEQVQQMVQNAVQAMQQAMEQAGQQAGEAATVLAPYLGDALAHLPEVGP